MYKHTKLLIFAKQIDGGTGTFVMQVQELSKYIKNLKITTLVLDKPLFRKTNQHYEYFYKHKQKENRRYASIITLFRILFYEFLWLSKKIKENKPHVILTIDSHCNLLVCLLKIIFFWKKINIILTFHNNIEAVSKTKLNKYSAIIFKIIGNFLYSKANIIIAVSNGASTNLIKFFRLNPKNVETIYYGINSHGIRTQLIKKIPSNYQYLFDNKTQNIISVGRLVPQKDFMTLIKAYELVHKQNARTRLIIVGDGEDKNKLTSYVNDKGLTSYVIFLPWQQNIYAFLNKCDLFVLSSNYEGFPYILLEALSCHIPIVATNTSYGPQELLDDGKYGILVPVEDIESMSSAIIKILSNNQLKKTIVHLANSRIKNYSLQNMLLQYSGLIENMVKV